MRINMKEIEFNKSETVFLRPIIVDFTKVEDLKTFSNWTESKS